MTRSPLIYISFLLLSIWMAHAAPQSESVRAMENERAATERDIRETTQRLSENEIATNRKLNEYNELSAQIDLINDSISTITSAIDSIDIAINSLNDSIENLESHLESMKSQYASALKKFQGTRIHDNALAFIFSAESAQQSYRRIRYLQQFSRWRSRKTQEILDTKALLEQKRANLVEMMSSRNLIVRQLSVTRSNLEDKKRETDTIIEELRIDKQSLNSLLRRQEQEARQINNEIRRLIEQEEAERRQRQQEAEERRRREQEETARRQREQEQARQNSGDSTPSTVSPSPIQNVDDIAADEDIKLTGNFKNNKGNLPAPVSGKYLIVKKFGKQSRSEISSANSYNYESIDMQVTSGAPARAVFDGEVVQVSHELGLFLVIVIRHGDYYTSYARLSNFSVAKGDKVKAGQAIGTVYANPNDGGRSILTFSIYSSTGKPLNPQIWLKKQ